ncbi:hypothetical protein PAMA_003950 [Pampus argenteus]
MHNLERRGEERRREEKRREEKRREEKRREEKRREEKRREEKRREEKRREEKRKRREEKRREEKRRGGSDDCGDNVMDVLTPDQGQGYAESLDEKIHMRERDEGALQGSPEINDNTPYFQQLKHKDLMK